MRLACDERLVALVRAGDGAAFEAVYNRYARKLLSFCRHMLGSPHDAEDAVQRSFASAYRALVADERTIELRPWLFTIARNVCLSTLRQRRATVAADEVELATEGLASQVQQREDLRNLLGDLQGLPERQRAALLLAELGGFSHAHIAQVLDIRADQVKSQIFQARTTLMAERAARETSCDEIREQLATLRGARLLRGDIRRHVRACAACRSYGDEVALQRRQLALLLPVAPSLALKSAVLQLALGGTAAAPAGAAIAGGGASAALGSGGSMAPTGATVAAGVATKALVTKALIAALVLGTGAGTIALRAAHSHHRAAAAGTPRAPRTGSSPATSTAAGSVTAAGAATPPVTAAKSTAAPASARSAKSRASLHRSAHAGSGAPASVTAALVGVRGGSRPAAGRSQASPVPTAGAGHSRSSRTSSGATEHGQDRARSGAGRGQSRHSGRTGTNKSHTQSSRGTGSSSSSHSSSPSAASPDASRLGGKVTSSSGVSHANGSGALRRVDSVPPAGASVLAGSAGAHNP